MPKCLILLIGVAFFYLPCKNIAAFPEIVAKPSIKIWQNEWIYEDIEGRKFQDSSFLAGPSIKLVMGKTFAGFTIMRSLVDYNLVWQDYEMNTPRTDIDIVIGHIFGQSVTLFTGYKNILYDPDGYKSQNWYFSSLARIDAGVVGIGVFKAINKKGLTLSASIAGGIYDATAALKSVVQSETDEESDIILLRFGDQGYIYSAEFGVAFPISEKTFLNFGYKYQTFENSPDTRMQFKGLTFSIDFVF